mmetsp:Transcript_5787/g.8973  ORF Transcript_5787/g.8973 Transcript_5787/m.8973 type:complete len:385 (-) Transcript_5787:132-1286(-)
MPPTEMMNAASEEEAESSTSLSASFQSSPKTTPPSDSITDVVSHLHNLLQTKETELHQREAEFDRRVKSFEAAHPSIGSDTDVIQLNVGGRTNIAVLRNTLTQFEDSMLAAKFSGRWDDSMEKDRDGNVFVDEDPDNFGQLLKFLRMRMKLHRGGSSVPERHQPKVSYEFCSMLEYYNLMQGVYGHNWVGAKDSFTCEEIAYGIVSLCNQVSGSNDGSTPNLAAVVYPHRSIATRPELKLLEFTVEFEKGTTGYVGWVQCTDEGARTIIPVSFKGSLPNSMFLSIEERKAFGPKANTGYAPDNILGENLRVDHAEAATKVVCRRSGGTHITQREHSIELEDGTKVEAILNDGPHDYNDNVRLLPFILFSGKVTVSGLKYAIDEL